MVQRAPDQRTFGKEELPEDLPWIVIALRIMGFTLLLGCCLVSWAAAIATAMLGPVWGMIGVLIAALCFAVGFMCFSDRLHP